MGGTSGSCSDIGSTNYGDKHIHLDHIHLDGTSGSCSVIGSTHLVSIWRAQKTYMLLYLCIALVLTDDTSVLEIVINASEVHVD